MRATGTQQLLKGVQRLFWFGVACVVLFKNVNMLTAFRHQDGACKKPNVCLHSSVATLSPKVGVYGGLTGPPGPSQLPMLEAPGAE